MFFQQFFTSVRTFNPLTSHYFTIYHFYLIVIASLARVDCMIVAEIVSSLPSIHSLICITINCDFVQDGIMPGGIRVLISEPSLQLSMTMCPNSVQWVLSSSLLGLVLGDILLSRWKDIVTTGMSLLPFPLSFSPEHRHDNWSCSKHLATTRWQA